MTRANPLPSGPLHDRRFPQVPPFLGHRRLLLFLALVAIVVTGFGTGGFGGLGSLGGGGSASGDPLATVDGEPITASRGQRPVNRAASSSARQQQPTLDMAEFLAQGGFDRSLDR